MAFGKSYYHELQDIKAKLGITLAEACAVVEFTDKLPENKKGFAESLIKASKGKGLSEGQEFWMFKLAEMALGKAEKPEPEKVASGFAGLYALFATAKKKLKFPKINLVVDGYPVVLSLAGAKSKVPNVVNVTDGEPFGYNKWYGRVYEDGKWEKGHKEYAEADKVRALLRELGKAPAETAIKYGKLTGRCCFCNKSLTDEHSTAVGFGKTCAENFGLLAQWKAASGVLSGVADGAFETEEVTLPTGQVVKKTKYAKFYELGAPQTIPVLDPGMMKTAKSAHAVPPSADVWMKFNPEKEDPELLPILKDPAKLLKPTDSQFPLVMAAVEKSGLLPEGAEVVAVKGVNMGPCPACEAEKEKVEKKVRKPKPGDTMKVLF